MQTFLVPMVESAGQAQALARALRYPPAGTRGLASWPGRLGPGPRHLQRANEEICLLVQVETTEALANLTQILAVDGVDGVFIGPSDLSASMGHIGDPAHPEVVAAISTALGTIAAAGKFAGVLCIDPALAEVYRACGANFIGVGVDTLILAQGARRLAQAVKSGEAPADTQTPAGY